MAVGYSWETNPHGQLGDGTLYGSNVPVAVDSSGKLNGHHIIAAAAGFGHSVLLSSTGEHLH